MDRDGHSFPILSLLEHKRCWYHTGWLVCQSWSHANTRWTTSDRIRSSGV